ncbi:5-hydroxytryptamine receptor 3A-like [Scomber scombrus]|uniref:5-hydroxytryptamine receptor 3A-like n=1 Tax=Scomber scombrus TaxID=13677 RepID=UPI002DDA291E|nr:5-hydroxytryptamine receptor 3A-like [Scomber scombrus]
MDKDKNRLQDNQVSGKGGGYGNSNCTTRRCLAETLINRNYSSQPQNEDCTQIIKVPFIEYQTLSVEWKDLELKWDKSVYQYDTVVLPVNKIWTPELHVTNGILTTMKHNSHDLLVYSNGTVKHMVIINAEVNCEVNLFNYPFAADECPVAIQAWSIDGCGTELVLGTVKMVDSTHGDWQTDDVKLQKKRDDRNYIMVSLSIKYLNPFLTLMLPSILLILTDVVSFALPLGGGERNSFKVTLVLSFTMFLIILNDKLPGDSDCSPIIRPHFCICLALLVLSMLVSLVLTRVAKDGGLIFCCMSKGPTCGSTENKEEKEDEEAKADVPVTQLDASDSQILRKVVYFLESLDAKELKIEKCQEFANTVDKIFFWWML